MAGGPVSEFDADRGPTLLYYSYVTLTTLGYGDVLPTTGLTQGLSALEAVIGQLYVAVLIGRVLAILVASQMAKQK